MQVFGVVDLVPSDVLASFLLVAALQRANRGAALESLLSGKRRSSDDGSILPRQPSPPHPPTPPHPTHTPHPLCLCVHIECTAVLKFAMTIRFGQFVIAFEPIAVPACRCACNLGGLRSYMAPAMEDMKYFCKAVDCYGHASRLRISPPPPSFPPSNSPTCPSTGAQHPLPVWFMLTGASGDSTTAILEADGTRFDSISLFTPSGMAPRLRQTPSAHSDNFLEKHVVKTHRFTTYGDCTALPPTTPPPPQLNVSVCLAAKRQGKMSPGRITCGIGRWTPCRTTTWTKPHTTAATRLQPTDTSCMSGHNPATGKTLPHSPRDRGLPPPQACVRLWMLTQP